MTYPSKFRVMVLRAASCLRLCDRLSSPLSVTFRHLIVRANEMGYSYYYSLLPEDQSDCCGEQQDA